MYTITADGWSMDFHSFADALAMATRMVSDGGEDVHITDGFTGELYFSYEKYSAYPHIWVADYKFGD